MESAQAISRALHVASTSALARSTSETVNAISAAPEPHTAPERHADEHGRRGIRAERGAVAALFEPIDEPPNGKH
jgi:hypothetical protein